jgi:hypothetical protein
VSVVGLTLDGTMTDHERALLLFEEAHPRRDHTKEAASMSTFGITWVRYQQQLLRPAAPEDVNAEFALLAHRVTRSAAARSSARAARRFATRVG